MQTEINLPFITADQTGPKHLTMTLTRSKLEQLVDDLLDKLEDLSALKELKDEISSMKSILERIQTSGTIAPRVRGPRADLSSLDIDVVEKVDGLLSPPERPLLDSVLDSMLFFDDEELFEDNEITETKEHTEEEED